jgi:hypothetical protein
LPDAGNKVMMLIAEVDLHKPTFVVTTMFEPVLTRLDLLVVVFE